MKPFLALFLLAVAAAAAASQGGDSTGAPERRRDQFPSGFGYAIFPYPYSLPGIGSGLSLVAGALNIGDSYTDAYGIVLGGDVSGGAVGVGDLHLIPRTLILDVGYSSLSRASIQSYSQRGMGTGKDDFSIAEIGESDYFGGRLTATFFNRRFELYSSWFGSSSKLKSVRDHDGDLILEAQNPPRDRGHTTIFGTRLDLTDDYADPRRGLRADISRTQSPPKGSGADYYVMDYSATAYVPFARWNTLAINLLRSDAFVRREGVTDPAALQAQLGIDCASVADAAQRQTCNDVIVTSAAANRFGTASQLGGFNRLRSYPQGRFKGAHTLFLGAEYRWNLTDEATPFDIFIMKDVRTAIQLAAFYETGVTSDDRDDLYKRSEMRDSYGAGLRIVTGSGVVFRADLAHGKEGLNAAIFIGYPWELQ